MCKLAEEYHKEYVRVHGRKPSDLMKGLYGMRTKPEEVIASLKRLPSHEEKMARNENAAKKSCDLKKKQSIFEEKNGDFYEYVVNYTFPSPSSFTSVTPTLTQTVHIHTGRF